MSNVVIKRHRDTGREMNGAESRKIGQEAGVNEDGEGLQISGDRDCELCAGNKQGRDR